MRLVSIITIALQIGVSGAMAQGLGEIVQNIGPWNILKKTDPMTDAVRCLAIYQGNSQVQLTIDSLAIGLQRRGGVTRYQVRLDDDPASDLKDASESERDVGAVLFEGDELEKMLLAKRVRFQAVTLRWDKVNEDLDFSEIAAVREFLKSAACRG